MQVQTQPDFRRFLSTILCAFLGVLISVPVAMNFGPLVGIPALIIFGAIGARIGRQRGESTAFFYFALICTLILVTLLSRTVINAGQLPTP